MGKVFKLIPFIPRLLKGDRFILFKTGARLECAEHGVIHWFSWAPDEGLVYSISMDFCPFCGKRLNLIPEYNSVPILCFCGFHQIKKGEFCGWHFEICLKCNHQKVECKGTSKGDYTTT